MITPLPVFPTIPDKNINSDKVGETANKLAGSLMSQMVNSMFKTVQMPQEQELFISFLAEAVGDHIAQSGMTDKITQSIQRQMMRFQKNNPVDFSPEKASKAYEELQ